MLPTELATVFSPSSATTSAVSSRHIACAHHRHAALPPSTSGTILSDLIRAEATEPEPDGLPDPRNRCVIDPPWFEDLFPPRLGPLVRGVKDPNEQFLVLVAPAPAFRASVTSNSRGRNRRGACPVPCRSPRRSLPSRPHRSAGVRAGRSRPPGPGRSRRYQRRSACFITPDRADSTGNGTRICSLSSRPTRWRALLPSLPKPSCQIPLRLSQSLANQLRPGVLGVDPVRLNVLGPTGRQRPLLRLPVRPLDRVSGHGPRPIPRPIRATRGPCVVAWFMFGGSLPSTT